MQWPSRANNDLPFLLPLCILLCDRVFTLLVKVQKWLLSTIPTRQLLVFTSTCLSAFPFTRRRFVAAQAKDMCVYVNGNYGLNDCRQKEGLLSFRLLQNIENTVPFLMATQNLRNNACNFSNGNDWMNALFHTWRNFLGKNVNKVWISRASARKTTENFFVKWPASKLTWRFGGKNQSGFWSWSEMSPTSPFKKNKGQTKPHRGRRRPKAKGQRFQRLEVILFSLSRLLSDTLCNFFFRVRTESSP